MTNSICSKHIKALQPRREYCVICLLEERYALQDALDNLARATASLLEELEDLFTTGDREKVLGQARNLIDRLETNTFGKETEE